jgi:hypothetical protein
VLKGTYAQEFQVFLRRRLVGRRIKGMKTAAALAARKNDLKNRGGEIALGGAFLGQITGLSRTLMPYQFAPCRGEYSQKTLKEGAFTRTVFPHNTEAFPLFYRKRKPL